MGSKIKNQDNSKSRTHILFNDDDDGDNVEGTLKVNSDYAAKYENWRGKEELQKLKDKYGDDDSESSSSSDSDDETPSDVFGKDFLTTLACLKSKDPKIYDKNFTFFSNEEEQTQQPKHKKSKKPLYLPDYERKILLEYNGKLPDEEEDENEIKVKLEAKSESTYDEEQRKLKESFKQVTESDSDDDLLTLRVKTSQELKKEEDDYLEWIKGNKQQLESDNDLKDMKPLREYWNNPALDEDEKFLRNFILEKKYLEQDDNKGIPTYDEITKEESDVAEEENFSDDQETFEHKYNFRFEEPDPEFIKRYPRTVKDSMRRKDTRRKDKRLEIREKKEREKAQKREELKRLKALKRKEILEKISKIKEITGNTKIGFEGVDLEGDFDPDDYDAKMKVIFNQDYYGEEDADEEKPVFPLDEDDEEYIEHWDEWDGNTDTPACEDPDFNMDCDYDPNTAEVEPQERSGKRRKKRQSKLREALRKTKPVFNPSDNTFEEYLDEYYKLDYEDIIDDLPCRFKYRKVLANDFGLTLDEILTADDKELNKWCTLKKTCQIRTEEEEKYDLKAFARKANDWNKKRKILKTVYNEEENVEEAPGCSNQPIKVINQTVDEVQKDSQPKPVTKIKNKKRKRTRSRPEETLVTEESQPNVERKAKRKKRCRQKKAVETDVTDERLRAYGINPKKYKNKLKYSKL